MPFQFRKEAIEEDLNSNFPSQGQGNPPLYYSLSEVVVPTYSINSVAEGSGLPENLQTAWDFGTGQQGVNNSSADIITTPGFWRIGITVSSDTTNAGNVIVSLNDGVTNKPIWEYRVGVASGGFSDDFVVFVRSGDVVKLNSNQASVFGEAWYRQIADVNGTLTNPLGFSFA